MRLIGANSARRPPWITDGIDGRSLCTLIFSVVRPLSLSTLLSFAQNTTEAAAVASSHQLASQFLSNSLCRYPKYQVPSGGTCEFPFQYLDLPSVLQSFPSHRS